jgi:uncharacterized membrane protein YkgB
MARTSSATLATPPRIEGVPVPTWLERFDRKAALVFRRTAPTALRWAVAIVFIWFGALKFTPYGAANELVAKTIWFLPASFVLPTLATWEIAIGVLLLIRPLVRVAIGLLALQMAGTFLPLVLFPGDCFRVVPWVPTLEGQYILKNLVIIAAAIAIGGTVRRRVPRGTASLSRPA